MKNLFKEPLSRKPHFFNKPTDLKFGCNEQSKVCIFFTQSLRKQSTDKGASHSDSSYIYVLGVTGLSSVLKDGRNRVTFAFTWYVASYLVSCPVFSHSRTGQKTPVIKSMFTKKTTTYIEEWGRGNPSGFNTVNRRIHIIVLK